MSTAKQYWMFSRPQRKLYRLPLTVTKLHEIAGEQQWQGSREAHIAFEELLEQEGVKRIGPRRDGKGSGGRTHAALVRSLGLAFDSSETGHLELTLAGLALADGQRPLDVLKHQVLRFQFPSPYSVSRNVNIDSKFKVRPFVLLLRLLVHPSLERRLTEKEVAHVVLVSGTGDSSREADRVAREVLNYRSRGFDEATFVADYGADSESFPSLSAKLLDIANTAFNWLELTGVIERNRGTVLIPDSLFDEAEQLIDQYGARPRIANPDDADRFQRAYGLPPWKQKDLRRLVAVPVVGRSEYVRRRVATLITKWSATELLIQGATSELIDRLARETQFSRDEVAVAAALVMGSDRTLDSFLTHYQSLVYSRDPSASREFEQVTAELFRTVFGLTAECVGQGGREPDVVLTNVGRWRAIVDTKAYSNGYALPADHERAMEEYARSYTSRGADPLRFWVFIAGAVSSGADNKAKALAQRIGTPGVVVGMLAWLRIVRLARANLLDVEQLAELFSRSGEVTLEDVASLHSRE